jgi:nitroreductase
MTPKPIHTLTTSVTTAADAIYGRRSVRKYRATPVEATEIRALLHAAVQAPTAMHAEPWMFVVVQDPAVLRRVSDVAKQEMIEQAHLYRDLHDPSVTPKNGGFLKALGSPDFNIFYDAGTLILIGGRTTTPYVSGDCWLAAENLMLAAAAMGLGTCCIGSALPAVNMPDVKASLSIPSDVSVIAAIIVGVPADVPAPTGRKEPVILNWIHRP